MNVSYERRRVGPIDTFEPVECRRARADTLIEAGTAAAVPGSQKREVAMSAHIPNLAVSRRLVFLLAGLMAVASAF
jgi:hypothetical protein